MNGFLKVTGILTWIALLVYGANHLYENNAEILDSVLRILGVVFVALVVGLLTLRSAYGKNWALKAGSEFYFGSGLITSTENLIREVQDKSVQRETVAKFVSHIIWRITRIGIIGLLFAGLPLWLLWQQNTRIGEQTIWIKAQTDLLESQDKRFGLQNDLISKQNILLDSQTNFMGIQNRLFDYQNSRIDRQIGLVDIQNVLLDTQNYRLNLQNNLMEADRRSSLVFLMSNVLDKVDEEIKQQGDSGIYSNYRLSKPLINRIVSLSRAFRPYKTMEEDTLSNALISPERTQLFIALMENNLDSLAQNTIVESGDFSFSTVGEINLENSNLNDAKFFKISLKGANLRHTSLKRAILEEADLRMADLSGADLSSAILIDAKLTKADLKGVKLSDSEAVGANFDSTNLARATLGIDDLGDFESNSRYKKLLLRDYYEQFVLYDNIRFNQSSFKNANLRGASAIANSFSYATFRYAILDSADFRFSYLKECDLRSASLKNANFSDATLIRANLSGADLSGVDFRGANLSHANLEKCKIDKSGGFKKEKFKRVKVDDVFIIREDNTDIHKANLTGANLTGANLKGLLSLTIDQLLNVYSLYQCKNLDPKLEMQLRQEKPCLFEDPKGPNACPE